MFHRCMALLVLFVSLPAYPQVNVPAVQIPPGVMAELKQLETRFESALAQDCPGETCFSQGCTYLAHETVDKPRDRSLPGLADKSAGPGSVAAQEYLKAARCEFSAEATLGQNVVEVIKQRLRRKLSAGFLTVTVVSRELPSIPQPTPEDTAAQGSPVPGAFEPSELKSMPTETAWLQFWNHILPHFWWMIGLLLLTFCVSLIIWSLRRLGKTTIEEQLLLAELAQEKSGAESAAPAGTAGKAGSAASGGAVVAGGGVDQGAAADPSVEHAEWNRRFQEQPALFSRIWTSFLMSGRVDLAARLALHFAPQGQGVPVLMSGRNLEVARYLESSDPSALAVAPDLFQELRKHHAVSALLASEGADLIRRVQSELSASGFPELLEWAGLRTAAVVFSWLVYPEKCTAVRNLSSENVFNLASYFMRSERIDLRDYEEVRNLLDALAAGQRPVPTAPPGGKRSSDSAVVWGEPLDSGEALSALFSSQKAADVQNFLARWQKENGLLPEWMSGCVTPGRLLALPQERRKEVVLQLSPAECRAWMRTLNPDQAEALLAGLPETYLASVRASASHHKAESEDFWRALRAKLVSALL